MKKKNTERLTQTVSVIVVGNLNERSIFDLRPKSGPTAIHQPRMRTFRFAANLVVIRTQPLVQTFALNLISIPPSRVPPGIIKHDPRGRVQSFELRIIYELFRYRFLIDDLRQARRAAGLSQQQLADRLGMTVQVIKRLEAGVASVETLLVVMSAMEFRLSGLGPGLTLGEQLRGLRAKRSLTLKELSHRTGLSRTTIASLERGGGTLRSLQRLLGVLAPKVRRRAPERVYWGKGDKLDRDSRFTPPEFMAHIYAAFGEIDLDPCAHTLSPVVARQRILLSEGGDGLVDDWSGRLAFCNPPYSEQLRWLQRVVDQWQVGNVETVLCLVPSRTDSKFFHETLSVVADIYLLQGRVKFLSSGGKAQQTPFSLMLVMLGASAEQKAAYAARVPGTWLPRSGPSPNTALSRPDPPEGAVI